MGWKSVSPTITITKLIIVHAITIFYHWHWKKYCSNFDLNKASPKWDCAGEAAVRLNGIALWEAAVYLNEFALREAGAYLKWFACGRQGFT